MLDARLVPNIVATKKKQQSKWLVICREPELHFYNVTVIKFCFCDMIFMSCRLAMQNETNDWEKKKHKIK